MIHAKITSRQGKGLVWCIMHRKRLCGCDGQAADMELHGAELGCKHGVNGVSAGCAAEPHWVGMHETQRWRGTTVDVSWQTH